MATLREKREERQRRLRELTRRAKYARAAQAAQGVLDQPPRTALAEPVIPTIPQGQQAAFTAQQTAQRPSRLPFGVQQADVYAPTAAVDKRGKPEFGSFFGSGVLETGAGIGLGVLENLQKGIETFGGAAVGLAGAVTPGDLFGFQANLNRIEAEKGDPQPWNLAGQAQNLAEAFRQTDMPSTQVTLPFEIGLGGDRKLHQISVGVKGGIELLPDAILAILTGGTSAVGTAARTGLRAGVGSVGRGLGRGVMGATGLDIAVGASKGLTRKFRNIDIEAKVPEVTENRNVLPIEQVGETGDIINEQQSSTLRQFISAIPDIPVIKGTITGFLNLISPNILLDTSNEMRTSAAGHMRNLAISEATIAHTMARLFDDLKLKSFPERTGEEVLDYGDGWVAGKIRKVFGKIRKGSEGRNFKQASGFGLGEYGQITGTGTKLDGMAWVNAVELLFKNDNRTISRYKDVDLGNARFKNKKTGKTVLATGATKGENSFRMLNKNEDLIRDGFEGGKHSDIANFVWTYQNYSADVGIMLSEAGVKVDWITKSDDAVRGMMYAPRFLEMDDSWLFNMAKSGEGVTAIGSTPMNLQTRKLTRKKLQDAVDNENLSLNDPFQSMENLLRGAYRAARDEQLTRTARRLAEGNQAQVIDTNRLNKVRKGVLATFGRKRRKLKKTKKNPEGGMGQWAKVKEESIQWLENNGMTHFAQKAKAINKLTSLESRKAEIKSLKEAFSTDMKDLNKTTFNPKKDFNVDMPAYAGLLFKDKDELGNILKSLGATKRIGGDTMDKLAEIGDTIRVGKTGFDFGFPLIQGLPALGFAASTFLQNPKKGLELFTIWGKAVGKGFESTANAEVLTRNLIQNREILSEAISKGRIQLSRNATDIFIAVQNQTAFAGLGRPGREFDEIVKTIAKPFERAYVAPGDFLRIEYYRVMRETALQHSGDQGLSALGSFVNKMTGALNPLDAGISPNQSAIERNILFFSQRYTRSSMGLMKNFFDGGLEGEFARRAITGMAGAGLLTYWALAKAHGEEPKLNPSKSDFMTFKVGDDLIGVGSFWTQMARLTGKLSNTAWDEEARAKLWDKDDSPIVRFLRGRSAPVGGLGWDLATGHDFMGKQLNEGGDWTEHLSRQLAPIWFEATILDSPYRVGPVGAFAEVFGGRIRPASAADRRRSMRDDIAFDNFGKKWGDLNKLQKSKIRNYNKDLKISEVDAAALDKLEIIMKAERGDIGDELNIAIDAFWDRNSDINDQWADALAEGQAYLDANQINPAQFRNIWLKGANAQRRSRVENELYNEQGEFALVNEHFAKNATRFGPDTPEDVAYVEYITNIISGHENFEEADGFNFRKRDKEIEKFRQTWGDEVYSYVQQLFAEGRQLPAMVYEYYQGRRQFEHYWKDVEETVLERSKNGDVLTALWDQWLEETNQDVRDKLEEDNPILKTFRNNISDVRKEMRARDQNLDAWLYRWGFTSTLRHPANDYENAGRDIRYNGPLPLERFGIKTGIY